MTDRLGRLRGLLGERGVEAALVSLPANRFYLSGFPGDDGGPDESAGVLLVDREGATLFTGGTNAPWALATVRPGVAVAAWERPWEPALGKVLSERGWSRVGFEDAALSVASHREIGEGAGAGVELVPLGGSVSGLRAVKEPEELALLERAIRVTDEAFVTAASGLAAGWTERRLAGRIDDALRALGADGPAFPTIVAAGPNAAKPHHEPGDHEIGAGEPVIVDMGARLGWYAADLTRTIWVGRPTPTLRALYNVVLAAQRAGLAVLRPGVGGKEVDAAARAVYEAAGHKEHALHGLGHGLGIRVHEAPSLGPRSEDRLTAGQVVTVEPGLYLEGWGGVRIEDVVTIEAEGYRVLTGAPKTDLEQTGPPGR